MFFKTYGLLGQNARNLKYIKGFNSKMARKLADSKLKTKEFLKAKGVAVPETFEIVKDHKLLTKDFVEGLVPPFVIKPNNGFGGKGIIVIVDKSPSHEFISNTGEKFSVNEMIHHLSNVIDGFFSLSGSRDKVIIEKRIEINKQVQVLGTYGLPDIRIIVFNMVPVMAMLRVPTKESGGKANLHSGACAAGIDIGTGKLTYISHRSKLVKTIPGIGDIRGLIIPDWDKMLEIAVKVQKETSIGYLGCDIVMDDIEGPLLLEMNIRPGLEVQIANMARLKDRLERVEGIFVNSVEKGVRLGKDLFSGDIEEKIRNLSGKKVMGAREYIELDYNEKKFKYIAEVRPGNTLSLIDKEFAKNVLLIPNEELGRPAVKLSIEVLGEKKILKFGIKELDGTKLILGLNGLKGFLLDPFKYKKGELPITDDPEYEKTTNIAVKRNHTNQLQALDKKLVEIDKRMLILKNITPINILEEKQKFIQAKGEYIPQFEYAPISIPLIQSKKELKMIEVPEIPLSEIYRRKKDEIMNKIHYLEAFKENDPKSQAKYSKKLFGVIDEENLAYAKDVLGGKILLKPEEDFLEFKEIQDYIKKFNHIYGINIKLRKSNKTARFVMNGDTLYFREGSVVGAKEMRSVIAHEIEGHYLRRLNGKNLEYSLFGHGTASYLEIDEGIAIYNQNRFLKENHKKFYSIFEGYVLVDYGQKHSYAKLHDKIMDVCAYDLERSFTKILRLKRGMRDVAQDGIFCKDVVYLNGLRKVEEYISQGGELKELYFGKMSLEDLMELKESYFMKLNFNDLKIPFFL